MEQLLCPTCGTVLASTAGDVRPKSWSETRLCDVCARAAALARLVAGDG